MFQRFTSNFSSFFPFITPKPINSINAISAEKGIYAAAVDGNRGELEKLIEQDKQRANGHNRLHCTPLMCTISVDYSDDAERRSKQYEAFCYLWDCTTNKEQADKAHNNVAFYAAQNGFSEAFELIIPYAEENDFSLFTQLNAQGKNILMIAIEYNRVEIVERLSRLHADIVKSLLMHHDNNDQSIVDYSRDCGNIEIEALVTTMLATNNLPAAEDNSWRIKRCSSIPRL